MKKLTISILILISTKLFFSSFNTIYPIPVYYTFETSDGVTHKWSRLVYDDIYGIIEETTEQVNLKYNNADRFEIERTGILILLQEKRYRTSLKIDSILNSDNNHPIR